MSSPVVDLHSTELGEGRETQKVIGVEEDKGLSGNVMGVVPMQEEDFGHGDSHFYVHNIEMVVGPAGESENMGTRGQNNDEGGAVSGDGVGPPLAVNFLSGSGVKDCGINNNFGFIDGVGLSFPKPSGLPKRARGYKKKHGGNVQVLENSGTKSGEPKTKKRRRSEEKWSYPLGNLESVESSADEMHKRKRQSSLMVFRDRSRLISTLMVVIRWRILGVTLSP
ncbi:hypothetical protein Hanom_Chr12g01117741 [Helianthus anomalus]